MPDPILIILSIGIGYILLSAVWAVAQTAYELWRDWRNKK